ncbi:hypothetical protein pipiens_014978 [Culex pipiens pipiens]|uniref:Uncharacterized protein n=1 Tax=Culex pipiens pipiens TaxID=38569 RepID=A0ABD1CSB9_CULPP
MTTREDYINYLCDIQNRWTGVLIEIGPILLFQTCTTTTKWRRLERTLVHWSGSTPRLTGPLVCPENRLGVGGEMVLRRAADRHQLESRYESTPKRWGPRAYFTQIGRGQCNESNGGDGSTVDEDNDSPGAQNRALGCNPADLVQRERVRLVNGFICDSAGPKATSALQQPGKSTWLA